MKRVILLVLSAVMFASPAFAQVVTFGDSSNYWGHQDNFNGVAFESYYSKTNQNRIDVNGIPDILGGSVDVDNHIVNRIDVKYTPNGKNINWGFNRNAWYNELTFGDLFIDTVAGSGSWDYVIRERVNAQGEVYAAGLYDISGLSNKYGADIYQMTPDVWYDADNTGVPRYDHPVYYSEELTDDELVGNLSFTGFSTELVDGVATASWVFNASTDLNLYGPVLLGLATNCANDVLLEEVVLPAPEPASFVLLAIGLLGMFGYGRAKKRI